MGAASSILASYADVMRVGGNIFCTQKIFTNNSNFRPQSTLAKTTSTAPALNTSASPMKQQDNTTDIKKEVVAKNGINILKLFHICGVINP